jgi:hypothetical protein
MILWSSERLEQALADGELDPWAKAKYIMVPAALGALATPFYVLHPIYGQRAPAINSAVSFALNVLAAYITWQGIKRCFVANNEIDGKAFFERTGVLAVPVAIRVITLTVLCSVVLLFVIGSLKERVPMLYQRASILFAAFNPIIAYAIWTMLMSSIQRLGKLIAARQPSGS